MNTCLLCTFKENCEGKSFLLYPLTPIVSDLLVRALGDAKIAHRSDNSFVRIDEQVSAQELASALKSRLSKIEMRDIRITKSRDAEMINATNILTWINQSDTSWFDRALKEDLFTTHFQPIVNYATGAIHGHECLIRLYMDRSYNGGEIMEAAFSRGRIHVFDSYTRQLSVRLAGRQHTPGTKVFINFMPSSIYDPAFCMKSTLEAMRNSNLKPEDIVFEVVESDAITDVAHLKKICTFYRDNGFQFALDDVGTGSNSLQMMCDLKPHYIKIDKSLISSVDSPMYRSTIRKIVELGQEFSIRVIAEGIETISAANACAHLGIDLMQGYYFARPSDQMIVSSESLVNLSSQVNRGASQIRVNQNQPDQINVAADNLQNVSST
jgi:EAL domain-containing protein (putative c-di-GMP-specific phosphodiesterase class I)